MTNRDEIRDIIIKSLETADNYDLAFIYNHMVVCTNCPYSDDCKKERKCLQTCSEYILEKLEEESEDKE